MLPSFARLAKLHSALGAYQAIWRPAPFHVRRPAWCRGWPELAAAALGLDDHMLDRLSQDPEACREWLAPRLPVVDELGDLVRLPPLQVRALPAADARFDAGIPSRKRAQVEAFAAHTFPARAPVFEWCAGKGHLGRRLAIADGTSVHSLEIDPDLCAAAVRLANRAGADQTVICADALDDASHTYVEGRSVLALHACGPLHRALVERAASAGARSYLISPCCYHSGVPGTYRPLAVPQAGLDLDANALRLAVTETLTAPRGVSTAGGWPATRLGSWASSRCATRWKARPYGRSARCRRAGSPATSPTSAGPSPAASRSGCRPPSTGTTGSRSDSAAEPK